MNEWSLLAVSRAFFFFFFFLFSSSSASSILLFFSYRHTTHVSPMVYSSRFFFFRVLFYAEENSLFSYIRHIYIIYILSLFLLHNAVPLTYELYALLRSFSLNSNQCNASEKEIASCWSPNFFLTDSKENEEKLRTRERERERKVCSKCSKTYGKQISKRRTGCVSAKNNAWTRVWENRRPWPVCLFLLHSSPYNLLDSHVIVTII